MIKEEIDKIKQEHSLVRSKVLSGKDKINLAKGQIEEINRQLAEEINKKEIAVKQQALYQKTAIFCSSVLENSQKSLEETFSNIGSSALAKIFGEDKKLKFSFDKKQNKNPSVNIEVSQPWGDGEELTTNIIESEGGAMVDIVALGLRIAMIKLITPEQKGPVFLDEICKYVAKNESIRATGEFLQEISEKVNRQIILITHTPGLFPYADKLFTFEIGPNKTIKIKENKNNEKSEE